MCRSKSKAQIAGGRPIPHPSASPESRTTNARVPEKDPSAQCHRRQPERIGAGPWDAAGALSGVGQSAAAKLFCGGGLQCQAMDPAQPLGTKTGTEERPAFVHPWLSKGAVCTGPVKPGTNPKKAPKK